MRLLAALLLSALVSSAMASEYERERQRPPQAKAHASAKAGALAVAAPITLVKSSPSSIIEASAPPKIPDNAAIAPNPHAAPPSAQCRFGWSLTGAVVEFGIGASGSEWDRICGLWLAAQQTVGTARDEAAAAAFCLTMKDAGVQSETCFDWENGQNALAMTHKVEMNDNQAAVVFSGSGGWN